VLRSIPFVANGDIPFFLDALFVSVSGFTKTGASILTDVEALSYCSLSGEVYLGEGGMGVWFLFWHSSPSGGTE
jgi:trk system potassium uptake protein TrkH